MRVLGAVILLFSMTGCKTLLDDCKDSQLGTSWCSGTVLKSCREGGGGEGFGPNALEERDCADERPALSCVEQDGKKALCGFSNVTCEHKGEICVGDWIAYCEHKGSHPIAARYCKGFYDTCAEIDGGSTCIGAPM